MKGKSFWRQGEDKFFWTCRCKKLQCGMSSILFPGLPLTSRPWRPSLANFCWSSETHPRHYEFLPGNIPVSFPLGLPWSSSVFCTFHSILSVCPVGLPTSWEERRQLVLHGDCIFCLYTESASQRFVNEWSWRDATVSAKNLDRVDRIAGLSAEF